MFFGFFLAEPSARRRPPHHRAPSFIDPRISLCNVHAKREMTASSSPPSADCVASAFARDGVVIVPGVLKGAALESFRQQVSCELTEPCIPPESGTPKGVSLSAPKTWPRGSARRVIEVVPPGVGRDVHSLTPTPRTQFSRSVTRRCLQTSSQPKGRLARCVMTGRRTRALVEREV